MTTEIPATRSRIDWVVANTRLLASIADEFRESRPFDGLTIGTGIHLEPKTVSLLLTLSAGGARVIATGNLNSTQRSANDYLEDRGITVVGGPTTDPGEHRGFLRQVIAAEPELILDNGGDLFIHYLERPYDGLLGGTEETTSGRMRLAPLREQIGRPVFVINDSPIKQFAENKHAVGQSVLESLMRITNLSTNGKAATVFGYGSVGKGVALNLRNAHARVTVVELDPVLRLEALLDGFHVASRAEALSGADFVVTVTGARDVITASDLPLLKSGVVVANAGHFPFEIDVDGIVSSEHVVEVTPYETGISSLRLTDGSTINLVGHGHMMNLSGPGALGNSIESMDLGFALQARCLEMLARGGLDAGNWVVPVPRSIDEKVANSFVAAVST